MAMYLRRAAVPARTTILLLRSSATGTLQSRSISHTFFSDNLPSNSVTGRATSLPQLDFLKEHRRGFAKGKKSKDDSGGGTMEAANIRPAIKESTTSQMEAAVEALARDLTKLRTGRASPGMLDHIIIETGGVKMPLSRLAVVSVMDAKTISVNPYDPNTVKELEKAIVSSPLGLNPKVDGDRLIASIPALTKEHIQAMCKIVTKSSEDIKQSIRRARQKALDSMKQASLPKDDAQKLKHEIDEWTKKYIKKAEDVSKAKEKEISEG